MEKIQFPEINPRFQNILEPECQRCKSLVATRNKISWGYGNIASSIMFIAEAPACGKQEDTPWQGSNYTGVPLTNRKSGMTIRYQIKKMGFDLSSDFYVTNTVKCFPPKESNIKKSRMPNADELRNCSIHLTKELQMVNPELIICIGGTALKQIYRQIGHEKIPNLLEVVKDTERQIGPYKICAMIHPSRFGSWLNELGWSEQRYLDHIKSMIQKIINK
ncbi:MAG: hypothetical protein K9K63_08680 [Desulfotignum sp.]|nr:hypothetical protein [Desulfotignum sp.]